MEGSRVADMDWGRAAVLALIAVAIVAIAVFTATLGGMLLGIVLVLVVAYLLWVVIGRLHDSLRHGKPLFRVGRGKGGNDGRR